MAARCAPTPRTLGHLVVNDLSSGFGEGADGLFACSLYLPGRAQILDHVQSPTGPRRRLVADVLATVDSLTAARADGQLALDAELRGYGIELAEAHLPPSIRESLWEAWEAGDEMPPLQIMSNSAFTPWELMYVEPPAGVHPGRSGPAGFHLGQLELTRSLPGTKPLPEVVRLGRNRAVVVDPRYRTVAEAVPLTSVSDGLLRLLGATSPDAVIDVVTKVLSEGRFDLFHFNGHGEASGDGSSQYLILDDSRLLPTGSVSDRGRWSSVLRASAVRGLGPDHEARPLVFLNGCQTGVWGSALTGRGGFAEAFLRRGASVFVGAQWRITDHAAIAYAEAFYELLIRGGATLAAAASGARRATGGEWSATPLAYAVYGDPEASRRRRLTAR